MILIMNQKPEDRYNIGLVSVIGTYLKLLLLISVHHYSGVYTHTVIVLVYQSHLW